MKIEKISDSQVKFVLQQADLDDRNLKISELAYGSEKTQILFREMMEQAFIECGFESENVPLMIEAIPASSEGITIIVTKVSSPAQVEEKFDLIPKLRSKMISKQKGEQKQKTRVNENISIFSFEDFNHVTNVSIRLYGQFNGTNVLFKDNGRYFLFLQNNADEDTLSLDDLESILSEYGQKHVSTLVAKHYLDEHGEIIIKNSAINVIAENFS